MTDGADVYTGLLCKYNNSIGSIVFQNSSGTVYKYSKSAGTIQTLVDETLVSIGARKIFNFNLTENTYVTTSYNDNWHKNKYYIVFHDLSDQVTHFYIRQCTTEGRMECSASSTGGSFTQYQNFAIELN